MQRARGGNVEKRGEKQARKDGGRRRRREDEDAMRKQAAGA